MDRPYPINGMAFGNVVEHIDLGNQVHNSLKVVKKAFGMLAFIAQPFEDRSWEVMLRWYRTLVRLLREYYVQFWLPSYRKGIKLER
eukprot:g42433.t1